MKNTFSKEERLCHESLITQLFHNGSSFVVYPFRVVYTFLPAEKGCDNASSSVKILVSVSKRRFKKAVSRNLLKRRTREAYRLNKHSLRNSDLLTQAKVMNMAIQYVGKEILLFTQMDAAMKKLIKQLNDEITRLH